MKPTSVSIGLCAVLLTSSACVGQQQCDTGAFTYNQSTGVYYMPGGFSSATSSSQCSCLQQQWNTINQQIQTEHESCLKANQGQTENPNTGSDPGSSCSYASCQSLHDALFTTMAPKEAEQMAACNAAAAAYQANLQAQQVAEQAAQQRQEVAAEAAAQRRAAELQFIKQQIAASLKTQQDAAQLMATLVQQLQTSQSQQGDSSTPQPPDEPQGTMTNAQGTPDGPAPDSSATNGAPYSEADTGNPSEQTIPGSAQSTDSISSPSSDSSQPASDLVAAAKDQLNSVVTPELQGAIGDAALEAGKDTVKEWVQESGVYGEMLVYSAEHTATLVNETSNFVQQASNLVDVFTGKTSPEQTANVLFTNFQQLGAQMLSNTVAGALFKSGSTAIWNANSIALGNLDQELSIAMSDGPYTAADAAQVDRLSDPTTVAQTAIFGLCSYCEKLYNAQRIVSGEWALLSTKYGWNVSNDN
jgi:FKBP-type peptidyl-prolyl cis-trans isomerase